MTSVLSAMFNFNSRRFPGPPQQAMLAVSLILLLFSGSSGVLADENDTAGSEPPIAPRLFPSDTMFYVRLDNATEFQRQMSESSIGKMIDDPQMRPFADEFYATASDLFEMISEQVGVSLDQLLSIPDGQIALAVHPAKPIDEDERPELDVETADDPEQAARRRDRIRRREAYGFGVTLIVDAGDNIDQLMNMVGRLEDAAVRGGLRRRIREVDDIQITRLLPARPGRLPVEFFQKDGTLVIGAGNSAAQDVLAHWIGDSEESSLADNANFGTIMSRCVGAEDALPQWTFFVDPHAIIDRVIKLSGSVTAGFVWPVIEDLGASRLGGIGGSSFHGGDVFEGIAHYHIKIDPPRDGVLGVLRPEKGETTPPDWVPESVAGYTSMNWDLIQTYTNVGKIIDKFQGEDSLGRFVEAPIKQRLGIELREEVLENLTGRLVRVAWIQPPARINSGVTVLALEVSDAIKAKAVLAKIRDRMPNQVTLETVGGRVLYKMRQGNANLPANMRRPEPCVMLIDRWLVYADSTQFMEKATLAQAGNLPRLVELPEYDLVAGELGAKLGGTEPFLLSYIDGAQGLKVIYDLARDESSRNMLRRAGENNVVARKFSQLLEKNELPPFSEFEKFFAPTGMFGYDEPDGIHIGFFTLRANPTDEP